jgi:hypothetical protein
MSKRPLRSFGPATPFGLPIGTLLLVGSVALVGCSDDAAEDAAGGGGASTGSGGNAGTGAGSPTGSTNSQGSGPGGGSGEGGNGTGGGPAECTPEGTFDGEPIEGDAGAWVWVDVPEALCRDGSPTGFGVRLNPASDKLFIYFEGGGACFNALSCSLNPASYDEGSFGGWSSGGGQSGIFDAENPDNPLRDWNVVYIPYCTGDVHAGDATDADVPGPTAPKQQSFVGYRNVGFYLDRIVPTFPAVSKVLVTGSSAGGFGATYNFDRIAQAFCPTPAVLIDDSGPAMSDEYLAPCLQTRWRELWGLDATLPAGCPECSGPDGGGIANYVTYLGNRYPDSRLGLLSTDADSTIRLFFGFGENDCANIDGLVPIAMSSQRFAEGLVDLRDNYLSAQPVWGTYYVSGSSHTFLGGGAYTSTTVEDMPLTEWVGTIVDGGASVHVGP